VFALLKLADLKAARGGQGEASPIKRRIEEVKPDEDSSTNGKRPGVALNLGYKIEVHLPATKDIEVFHAIFRSLRENILG
jgi:hypothetical protein